MKLKNLYPIALLAVLASFLPIRTLSAPDWSACVVDEKNRPIGGVLVRESYENYSAEMEGHDEDLYTDPSGCVRFSPKYARKSILRRLEATLYSADAGVHASFGPHSYITAFRGVQYAAEVRNGYVYNWEGSPQRMQSTLIMPSNK